MKLFNLDKNDDNIPDMLQTALEEADRQKDKLAVNEDLFI